MKYLFCLLTALTLSLPISLELFFPSWEVHLGGVTKQQKTLSFSLEKFFNGSYQQKFEKWFIRSLGVRSLLVKTDNQINYSLFSQLSSSRGGKALLGKDGHLIEKIYLKRAQGALTPKKKKLLEKVREIRKLNRLLLERNTTLIILVSANKPSTYPEIIPYSYAVPKRFISEYRGAKFLISALRDASIPVVSGAEIFEKITDKERKLLFAKTGTHWSELGSCYALSGLINTIREIDLEFKGALTCKTDGYRDFPLPIDRDLLSVANLWFPEKLIAKAPKVLRETISQPKNQRSSILFVGTSYLWSLFHHLNKTPFFSERDMYYYFKRSVPYPRGKERKIERSDPKWVQRALKHRYIVLEVNEAFPHRLGYGFPKRAVRALEQ